MQPKPPRIAIVDDHPVFGQTLKTWIEKFTHAKVVGVFTRGQSLLDSLKRIKPDFVFMDIQMPGLDGFETTKKVLELSPTSKIVIITMFDDALTIKKMLKLNVAGYITKDIEPDMLSIAIKKILAGECYITDTAAMKITLQNMNEGIGSIAGINSTQPSFKFPELSEKEIKVTILIAQGFSDKKISDKLFISPRTVGWHKSNIMKKIGAKKSTEIVAYAYKMKLI